MLSEYYLTREEPGMYQVIIVDDEPRILEGIIHLFPWNNFGFEVVASFTNGKEALEYINAHPQVDIVMTDIQMPVMTGIELSQKLKNEDIIVVFFSAYQDFEYARAAIINHVTDYLIKPMKYDAMSACFERIRKNLDKREKGHYLPYEVNADEADYVAIVKNYIKSDYKTATLEEAASLVHYSPAYLSSAFKADTGVSFSRYLLQVRMEQAMRMLSDRSVKFYEIADAVGYLNPKNLTRNFKEYYGITPQEFRAGKQPEVNPENRGPLS